ncbi:MAG: hypothetical protein ACREPD_16390 [Stenotrophomonas sp.]|uniref:hypothetical protein n=1 Tax=Gammaproteobacteria TaxID=1236 RepID=UPI003D6D0E03
MAELKEILVPAPRIIAASLPEDPDHTEYQYMFYVAGKRVGGLGLFGWEAMVEGAVGPERVFTLDLGRSWVLESLLRFKQEIGSTDDDLTFVIGMAERLVMANMDHSSSKYGIRYVAETTEELLARHGMTGLSTDMPMTQGRILLAQAANVRTA